MSEPSSYFGRTFIINLPERTDRLREVAATLNRSGFSMKSDKVEVFPAIKPNEAAGFPSIGARGCFLSHLAVLKKALKLQLSSVLILEDDVEFVSVFENVWPSIQDQLNSEDWNFTYFGYSHVSGVSIAARDTEKVALLPFTGELRCTHSYAVNSLIFVDLIHYLESLLVGTPGDRENGPMHIDGAFNVFRRNQPNVTTLIATPKITYQRSSHSDIHTKELNKIPALKDLMKPARGMKNWLRRARS